MTSGRSWKGVMRRKPSASHCVQYTPAARARMRVHSLTDTRARSLLTLLSNYSLTDTRLSIL